MTTNLTVLSLGAGVQSTTLLLMAVEGVLPKPDVAIFADTEWEPRRVYEHLDRLSDIATEAGIEVVRVSTGNLRDAILTGEGRVVSVPVFTVAHGTGKRGQLRRQCTPEFKLVPVMREIRRRLGAKAPDFRTVPAGRSAEVWIGFDRGEIGRIGGGLPRYMKARYPLIDLMMTRADCRTWLADRGWGDTPKSACIGCPFHGNRVWRDMRDNHPEEWADAVEFDHALRESSVFVEGRMKINGETFLHRERVPLDEADLRSPAQIAADAGQQSFFDLDEDGDPDGCGPFACRSGEPVVVDEPDEGAA